MSEDAQPILVSLYRIEQQVSGTSQWENVREPLHAARDEVAHLTGLADRFSSLAKLPPPRIEQVDLNALILSISQLYAEKLRSLRFSLELPDQPVVIRSDTAYLREALHNLLQNAIDACRDGDRIGVRLTGSGCGAEISITDTGRGMDNTTLASARLPYFTTKASGNGLGLAIVERSIAELGGQLKLESEENLGTRVTLALPGEEPTCRPES